MYRYCPEKDVVLSELLELQVDKSLSLQMNPASFLPSNVMEAFPEQIGFARLLSAGMQTLTARELFKMTIVLSPPRHCCN